VIGGVRSAEGRRAASKGLFGSAVTSADERAGDAKGVSRDQ